MKETRTERNLRYLNEQVQFMIDNGGTLEGYIKKHGDPGLTQTYSGEGGTAIFNADLKSLQRCIDQVDGDKGFVRGRRLAAEVLSAEIAKKKNEASDIWLTNEQLVEKLKALDPKAKMMMEVYVAKDDAFVTMPVQCVEEEIGSVILLK